MLTRDELGIIGLGMIADARRRMTRRADRDATVCIAVVHSSDLADFAVSVGRPRLEVFGEDEQMYRLRVLSVLIDAVERQAQDAGCTIDITLTERTPDDG